MTAPSIPQRAPTRLNRSRSAAWYARQERECLKAIVEAGKAHTEQEVADAEAALAVDPQERQQSLIEVSR